VFSLSPRVKKQSENPFSGMAYIICDKKQKQKKGEQFNCAGIRTDG
jgi:hypothetical protein